MLREGKKREDVNFVMGTKLFLLRNSYFVIPLV
jgi:hypothetical protein